MITQKDKQAIRKSKAQIAEQIEATKKLDLGLDADRSEKHQTATKSMFEGFINRYDLPPLEDK